MVAAKFAVGIAILAAALLARAGVSDFATGSLLGGGLLLIYWVRQRALEDAHERLQRREDTSRRPN